MINSELADVNIEEEDISARHTGIEKLRYFKLIGLFFTHDGSAFLYSPDGIFACDVHNFHPIFVRTLVDLFRGPDKLDVGHFHACGFPYFNEILSHSTDFLKIAVEFAIQHSEIICNPEDKDSSSIDHFVDIDSSQEALGDVHSAGWFETVIASEKLFFQESGFDVFFADNLATDTLDELNSLVD